MHRALEAFHTGVHAVDTVPFEQEWERRLLQDSEVQDVWEAKQREEL